MIKRIFFEIACLIAGIAIVVAGLNYFYRDYVTPVDNMFSTINTADPATRTMLIGNSHMGVIKHAFYLDTAFINVSMGGQDVFHQMLIMKYALAKLPNLKRVIMDIDYEMIGSTLTNSNQAYIDRQYYPYTYLLYDNGFTNRLASASPFFRSNRDLRYVVQHRQMQEEFRTTGKDVNFIPNEKPSPELCAKRANELTLVKFKQSLIPENLVYLHEIIALARERGIELVLMSTPRRPCFKSYMNVANVEFAKKEMSAFFKKESVPFYDYFSDTDFTDEDFRDPDHMNEQGELRVSQKLKRSVKAL